MRFAVHAAVLLPTTLSTAALAQTLPEVRERVRSIARETRYPTFVAVLAELAEDGELAGGQLDIEGVPETRIDRFALPWRSDLWSTVGGHALRAEATVGYVAARTDIADVWGGTQPGFETSARSRYEAFGLDLAAGPAFRLGDGTRIETLLHAGLAYVTNGTDYGGPGAATTAAIADGILFNWDGVYAQWGGSLAVRPEPLRFAGFTARPLARYDVRHTDGIHVDDPAQDAGDTTHWGTLRLDLTRPTGWVLAGAPVTWETGLGYRQFFGDTGDLLGFDYVLEAGTGFGLDVSDSLPWVRNLHLAGTVFWGEDVTGWAIGMSMNL